MAFCYGKGFLLANANISEIQSGRHGDMRKGKFINWD